MKKAGEIERELKALERKVGPLNSRVWSLGDQLSKARAREFLESGVIEDMEWRLRLSGVEMYLQYEAGDTVFKTGKSWPESLDVVIPYPHSHFELQRNIFLHQDDGDITIQGNSEPLVRFIKKRNLKILEWLNLPELFEKIQPHQALYRYLEANKIKTGEAK